MKKTLIDKNDTDQLDYLQREAEAINNTFVTIRDKYNPKYNKAYRKMKNQEEREKDIKKGDPEVRYAYVTFRSMNAPLLVKQSYKRYGPCQRRCINCCFDCCCKKKKEELRKKYIF